MGTSALMSIGVRAMNANYTALQTTGHNIANASVEGYSRQQVELATSAGQFTGTGFFGKGVDVASVTRSHNAFLTREAGTQASLASADKARLEQLSLLEAVFPPGEQGLGYAAGQFLNSMVDLASHPQDTSTREVVLARAQELATRFAAAGGQLDSLQAGLTQDLKSTVTTVNALAERVAAMNRQIAGTMGSGQPPNDLLDQRDQLIKQISGYVQVSTIAAGDGSVGLFIAGGQRLVLGGQASPLQLTSDPFDSSRSAIAINENGNLRSLSGDLLGAGSIGGLLRFQNDDLAAARNALGQMASAIAIRTNQQQALGLDQRSPAATGAPVFATGAPLALAADSNARDGVGNFLAGVSLAIADPAQLQASEYELRVDPATAGQYLLSRRSDGLVRSIASGDTVDGMTITVGVPAPAAGDRFLLQPVTRAANGMARVMSDPRGIAAASPLEATQSPANTGTARVAGLAVTSASVNPQNTASIAFTSAGGDYTWELRDRSSNALVSSGTGTWVAGQPIALNGFALTLDGVPAAGDSFSVARTANPASSNGNALAFVALRDEGMVDGQTITNAYASAMAGVGVRVQSARVASEMSTSAASAAEAQRASQAGVSLDEEAARLLQFQQGYQAAAKILQVAQSIFDALLQATNR